MVRSSGASVPSEQGEAGHADEETEGDEIEAEFGLVDAVVFSSGPFGATIG